MNETSPSRKPECDTRGHIHRARWVALVCEITRPVKAHYHLEVCEATQ